MNLREQLIREPFVRGLFRSIRPKDSGKVGRGGVDVNLLLKGLLTMCSSLFCLQVKTVQVERQTLQEEHDRLMGRQSLLLQELASKEKG